MQDNQQQEGQQRRSPADFFVGHLPGVRRRKGWAQIDLAQRLTEMGSPTHQSAIAKLENGDRRLTLDEAFRVAAALDVSLLSLCLPRRADQTVWLAPRYAVDAASVRTWLAGLYGLPLYLHLDDRGEDRHLTPDGQPRTKDELQETQDFYRQELDDTRKRLIVDVPGSWFLLRVAEGWTQAAARGDVAEARNLLNELRDEVARQLAALDHKEA